MGVTQLYVGFIEQSSTMYPQRVQCHLFRRVSITALPINEMFTPASWPHRPPHLGHEEVPQADRFCFRFESCDDRRNFLPSRSRPLLDFVQFLSKHTFGSNAFILDEFFQKEQLSSHWENFATGGSRAPTFASRKRDRVKKERCVKRRNEIANYGA